MFLHLLLGFWLGIYAARTYVPAAVWNVSDALPLYLKGAIAVGMHLTGVFAGLILLRRRRNADIALPIALAIITVARQFLLGTDMPGAILSMLSWIVWLCWFANVAHYPKRLVAPAFAAAFGSQMLLQWLWHGIDLPVARGIAAVSIAIILAVGLVATYQPADEIDSSLAIVVVGVLIFLELTLLANAGRIAIASTSMKVLLVVAQVLALSTVAIASSKHTKRNGTAFATGVLILFALLFAFYNRYEWPFMWAVAALVMATTLAISMRSARTAFDRMTVACIAFPAIVMLLPRQQLTEATKRATHHTLRVATYNVHQGFDNYGAPDVQQVVDEIQSFNADVIALQEVNRGWTLLGGADLIAYLAYRFPDYHIVFSPTNGDLVGVALMSRLPITNTRTARFDAPRTVFGYGYAAGDVDVNGDMVHVIAVHLTAGLEGNGGSRRDDQSQQLLNAVGSAPNVVIMGDFNSEPSDPPIKRIVAAGFEDVVGRLAQPRPPTWPALNAVEHDDYVFLRGGVQMTNGRIPATLASDHLPVVIDLNAGAAASNHAVNPQ